MGARAVAIVAVLSCAMPLCCNTAASTATSAPQLVRTIPLCPGLMIVTAISQSMGDYESIKVVQSITDRAVVLRYASESIAQDPLSNAPPHLEKTNIFRSVLLSDLQSSNLYEQQFYQQMPTEVPGTTAIGTSANVLMQLRTKGEADIGIFLAMSGDVSIDRDAHPNVFDFQMIAHIKRVEPNDVLLPLIVNDAKALLPAIHAAGDFFGDKTEFYFLDDPSNPITLKYRYGIGSAPSGDLSSVIAALDNNSRPRSEKDSLEVIKIAFRCSAAVKQTSAPPESANIEQQLAVNRKAEVYDIYFSFNNADIRPESEASLREIADILSKHPDWKLNVSGHTDSIGGHAFNLALSQRRAASVKSALVTRFKIDAGRLSASGFGDTQPQDTNATLQGRARNRRVELTRL